MSRRARLRPCRPPPASGQSTHVRIRPGACGNLRVGNRTPTCRRLFRTLFNLYKTFVSIDLGVHSLDGETEVHLNTARNSASQTDITSSIEIGRSRSFWSEVT